RQMSLPRKIQACILLSWLSLILVSEVTGLVPKLVVTTITGTDFGSLATNETALTGSQSRSEQQSASYQECDLTVLVKESAISRLSAARMNQPIRFFCIRCHDLMRASCGRVFIPRKCERCAA